MTYYFSIFLFASKYFLIYLSYNLIYQSLLNYVLILAIIFYLIIFCKSILNLRQNIPLQERIYSYTLEYSIEKYYSLVVFSVFILCYLGLILFLRIKSFKTLLDLGIVNQVLVDIYIKYSLIVLVFNLFLLFLILYLMFLIIKIIRNYVHKEIVKLHFYYLGTEKYKKIHSAIAHYYSINALIITKIYNKLYNFQIKLALGYEKNLLHFTNEEDILYDVFCKKYNKYFPFNIIRHIFYNLHIIFFIFLFIYDIIFNNAILINIFKFLPFMLLYQIYLNISTFVYQKPLTDICAETHIMFYHEIKIINTRTRMVDSILEDFDAEEFIKDFIKYENSDFTKLY